MDIAYHSIVNEIADGLDCLLATHSTYVDVGPELNTLAVQLFLCLAREERRLAHLFLGSLTWLKTVKRDC
jgi:hypothetical protein